MTVEHVLHRAHYFFLSCRIIFYIVHRFSRFLDIKYHGRVISRCKSARHVFISPRHIFFVIAFGTAFVSAFVSASVRAFVGAFVNAFVSAFVNAFVSAFVSAFVNAFVNAFASALANAFVSAFLRRAFG